MNEGDSACWLHLVCEDCGALIERAGDHRPACTRTTVIREIDVPALPRAAKHPTIFRLLDELAIGEALRLTNDHDPLPLRKILEQSAAGAFAWEYLESGPDRWRVDIRKLRQASIAQQTTLAQGPVIL